MSLAIAYALHNVTIDGSPNFLAMSVIDWMLDEMHGHEIGVCADRLRAPRNVPTPPTLEGRAVACAS